MKYNTIIVGAGIAGVSAALALSRHESVLVVEAGEPAAGASGVAGGLFSPMLALRGRPSWRMQESIEAFQRQLDETEAHPLFDHRGVLRPAHDEQQVAYFKDSIAMVPDEAEWLQAEESIERFPHIHAPFGSMLVHRGGAVHLPDYVRHLAHAAQHQGATFRTQTRVVGWEESENRVFVDVEQESGHTERVEGGRVLLCWGRTFLQDPSFSHLHLHQVKGQTIRATLPEGLTKDDLIPISSKGYVVPLADHVAIGSSYEHRFTTDEPTPEIANELLEKASHIVPALQTSTLIDRQAGFRVTVPGYRMPIVGPLPGYTRIHAFSAFGSKGLLLAPLLSYELPHLLSTPSQISPELKLRVKS